MSRSTMANEKPKEEIKKELKDFINKDTRELCEYLGFDFYLEVKNSFFLGKRQNHEDIIKALFEIINNKPVKVIRCDNEKIKKYFEMDLDKIKRNALLFDENKGDFYDEDPYICYCLLGEDFFTYILSKMLFFYGTKESVKKMADLYDKYSIDYHEPYKLDKYEPYDYPSEDEEESGGNSDDEEENKETDNKLTTLSEKIGRNEPCPCGSGKKYKKCCLKL